MQRQLGNTEVYAAESKEISEPLKTEPALRLRWLRGV